MVVGKLLVWYAAAMLAGSVWGQTDAPQAGNLLPNPSFELTEPADVDPEAPAERSLPRTWDVVAQWGAVWTCPEDPTQAHGGRRCGRFVAPHGGGNLRYGPIPVATRDVWTVRLWARGKGKLSVAGFNVLKDRWDPLAVAAQFDLQEAWTVHECQVTLPDGCRRWILDIGVGPETDVWIDDVFLGYPGSEQVMLPPTHALERDEHTLLYLPFEEDFDELSFFVKGDARLSEEEAGRFGRSLVLGPEGYVACSANESLDPSQGTIEVWVKLLAPGNDGVYHNFVGIPGPEGMGLSKDQYSHLHFTFSSGWGTLSAATAMGYAWRWQPGAWRHIAACWDKDMLQLFVDGKLIAWQIAPRLSRFLGPELGIGGPGMELDDLRISDIVRYRQPVPPDAE